MTTERKPHKKAKPVKSQPAKNQPGIMLHEWRVSQNLPLRIVAKDLQVSISEVSQWENARRYPRIPNLIQIAAYIGVPLGRLFCTRKDCPCQ